MEQTQNAFLEFIIERLEKYGSMPIQTLTGHLSQLSHNVREAVGTSRPDLVKFLKQQSALFAIDNKGYVHLNNSQEQKQRPCGKEADDSCDTDLDLPSEITNGQGRIIRLFPQYGFMRATEPCKTSVYFTALQFNDKTKSLLQDCDVREGDILGFNAKRGPPGCEAKYRAIRVWPLPKSKDCTNNCVDSTYIAPQRKRIRTNISNGLYDPMSCSGEGEIQKIFYKHGFIMIEGNPQNTIFFCMKNICNYKNITDLREVLSIGDTVEYNAIRSTKPESSVRWEATQVWIKSTHKKGFHDLNDEVFESNSENSACNSDEEAKKEKKISKLKTVSNCEKTGKFTTEIPKSKNSTTDHKIGTCLSKLNNVPGKMYPRGANEAVIKFGVDEQNLAIVKSSKVFVHNSPVTELMWEIEDGDQVHFDAIGIPEYPKWEAVLAWVGEKPKVSIEFTSPQELNSNVQLIDQTKESVPQECLNNEDFTSSNVTNIVSMNSYSNSRGTEENVAVCLPPMNYTNWGDSPFFETLDVNSTQEAEIVQYNSNTFISSPDSLKLNSADLHNKFETKLKEITTLDNKNKGNYDVIVNDAKSEVLNCKTSYPLLNAKTSLSGLELIELENVDNSAVIDNKTDESSFPDLKPGIYAFKNLCGVVKSVYNLYGECFSSKLRKPIVFSLKDLYIDCVRVSDKYKDIKKALKPGDNVFISGFEIVDDSNYIWQKATLVWKGDKPKGVKEASPAEFIEQLKLNCSFTCDINHTVVEDGKDTVVEDGKDSVRKQSIASVESNVAEVSSSSSSLLLNDTICSNKSSPLRASGLKIEKNIFSDGLKFTNSFQPVHSKCIKDISQLIMNYHERDDRRICEEEIEELSSMILELLLKDKELFRKLDYDEPKTDEVISRPNIRDITSVVLDSTKESTIAETSSSVRHLPQMCSVCVQTFSTGDILSVEIYPH